jgi:hypothetical protein
VCHLNTDLEASSMKLHRIMGLAVAIYLCAGLSAFGQGYKAETIGAVPADVPAAIQGLLDTQGVRVTNPQGATVCEVWLRKALPTSSSPDSSPDVLFGALTEGTFVGVIHFPAATTDFRSQNIKPGFYTLRYGLIPQDGNHMGVNPTRDAFLLAPISADTDPNAVLKFADLVKLSTKASGTPHPGFLVGAPVSGTTFPAVVKDDSGNWDLQLKGHGASGDVPLAFTVVGHWQG